MVMAKFDSIGSGYRTTRRADPRLVEALWEQLGLAPGAVVVDIGAGTGNAFRDLGEPRY